LKIKEFDTLVFLILSSGQFEFLWLKSINNVDTTCLNAVNKAISKILLDSIISEKYNTKGIILYSSKKLVLLEPIEYIVGRSRASIMKVVMKYLHNMRTAYNRRLKVKGGIRGKIYIKFKIDQYGRVFYSKLVSSTLDDELLNQAIVEQIKYWKFDFLYREGDVTEVVYPFVFSQN
jgi:TonB family protein